MTKANEIIKTAAIAELAGKWLFPTEAIITDKLIRKACTVAYQIWLAAERVQQHEGEADLED